MYVYICMYTHNVHDTIHSIYIYTYIYRALVLCHITCEIEEQPYIRSDHNAHTNTHTHTHTATCKINGNCKTAVNDFDVVKPTGKVPWTISDSH